MSGPGRWNKEVVPVQVFKSQEDSLPREGDSASREVEPESRRGTALNRMSPDTHLLPRSYMVHLY